MNGVIEWEKNGKPTGKFSPYIKIGKDRPKMFFHEGKPEEYDSWKRAKEVAKEREALAKQNLQT